MSAVSRETQARLAVFAALLERWNARINLVSPRDVPHLWSRHIDDSLQIVPLVESASAITDLGSGGGFPGLIVAIATGIPTTLIESDQRKSTFLREAARETGTSVHVVARRIELADVPPAPVVTARALAPVTQLLAWAVPLLSPGGACVFLKGRQVDAELTDAARDWHMAIDRVPSRTSPDGVILKIRDIRRAQTVD
ncbi:glucose inhibited division protein B [Ameyamaea chiangmaiensis NBRC 103196]|uniref:Ribosomal RNA small subunit methyltransferase G n=1 Tax=Ameyamaea chiangmaiensis TaxID=442969 RepID=A0A850PA26_9PROT|nr:16S rRNA (guanine(527)-N(7))-methyltransferase RsmG [Ameyamaea chiangmaiensis]MBS4074912.1 16S rRNA (guanine(527)-N(7))-methyltransferase RsmG [Ameyamaea chiangmaiensis]NVN40788.1 16S rRNA (guanine(527)-N(7))-methyltransferase RsmG [Ameyamaea chiangmaiensis]GBQ63189.1 glucose inhibited division protein B [Ameyamaea chiangmaiensis NBRC 103196]